MLKIDRLSIHMPPGFENRAADIARLISGGLEDYHGRTNLTVDSLRLSNIVIGAQATDQEVARAITGALIQALGRVSGGEAIPSGGGANE